MTENERLERVQTAMKELNKMGIDYAQMSVLLKGKVSIRTLYRWGKGETSPQREADVQIIEELNKQCKA